MGTAVKMGPAYFPTILSVLLMLIGTVSVIRGLVKQGTAIGNITVKGMLVVCASTALFGLLLRGGGLAIALPVLVVGSAAASSRFDGKYAAGLAAGLTFACWLIFLKGLGVPIPLLGSWFGK
jgi:putative tricarboxylic transport membrane protein